MLIREFLAIAAVIPHRNCNSICLSTTSVPFSSAFFHFKAIKLSVRLQTSCHAKPSLNPRHNGEEETDPSKLPSAEGIVGEGETDGESSGSYLDFDSDAREEEYDKDPEIADILNSCVKDPQKGRARVEERIKKKKNKILQTKTGSATPMKVTFNKFDFANSYIWFEFNYAPLPQDISLICDAIRCWHIIGRLGGCNSMNMQLSDLQMDKKIPTYDEIEGANVTPTTFYNIGDFELQDNLARICHIGIKQVVFGGTRFENWKENFNVEEAGCSIHKI